MKSKVKIKTQSFFNSATQRALYETVGGYISKEFYIREYIKILKERYNLDKVYRFDLGQNNDGCTEEIEQRFKELPGIHLPGFKEKNRRTAQYLPGVDPTIGRPGTDVGPYILLLS